LNNQIFTPFQGQVLIPSEDEDGFIFFPQEGTFSTPSCPIWTGPIVLFLFRATFKVTPSPWKKQEDFYSVLYPPTQQTTGFGSGAPWMERIG